MSESSLQRKFYPSLRAEIMRWQGEGIVSSELCETLLSRYQIAEVGNRVIDILTIFGAVLTGLGALLFIASNWQSMAASWKLVLMISCMLAANALGWFFRFEPGRRPRLGTSLFLLGSAFSGGSIWLIAQVFNFDIHYPTGILVWALGTAAIALATRVSALGILSSVLLSTWLIWQSTDPAVFGITFILALLFCYYLRSPLSLASILCGSIIWLLQNPGASGPEGLAIWSLGLFGGYLLHRDSWYLMARPYMYVSLISGLASLLLLTFPQVVLNRILSTNAIVLLVLPVLAILISVAIANRRRLREAAACLALMILTVALMFFNGLEQAIIANLLFLLALRGIFTLGLGRHQSPGMVNLSIVFFVAYLIARYFDTLFPMLDRSIFFIAGGVLLMIVGAIVERGRKKLLGGMIK